MSTIAELGSFLARETTAVAGPLGATTAPATRPVPTPVVTLPVQPTPTNGSFPIRP